MDTASCDMTQKPCFYLPREIGVLSTHKSRVLYKTDYTVVLLITVVADTVSQHN